MFRTLQADLSALSERTAVILIAVCSAGSILIYGLLFLPIANLLTWYKQPLIDLLKLMQTEPTALVRLGAGFILLAVLYLLGWQAIKQIHSLEARRWVWGIILGTVLLSAILLLFLYPFDAADIFDNIMHGRILGVYGRNPFVDIINHYPADQFTKYAAWKSSPSAYGPAWELVAGLTARLAGNGIIANIMAFKVLCGLFYFASIGVIAGLLNHAAPERTLSGVWLFALNPIILYETFGNGHNDMAMAVWIIVAAWLIYRKNYTGAVVALMVGALFKYIPALLIPSALWIGWRSLADNRSRIKFVIMSGAVCLVISIMAYAPFWNGIATLSIARRAQMFTTSLPSIIYQFLYLSAGKTVAGDAISSIALAMTGVFALWMAWQSGKNHNWLSFVSGSLYTLIFYLIVTCPWYQQWYVIWLVGLLALLPQGLDQTLALWITFISLAKPLIFGPLVFLQSPPDVVQWREMRLTAGVMVPSWLVTWLAIWQKRKSV